jgi:hypothetical protein
MSRPITVDDLALALDLSSARVRGLLGQACHRGHITNNTGPMTLRIEPQPLEALSAPVRAGPRYK